MLIFRPRWFFATTALGCAGLLAWGYHLEYHEGLAPCPMCILQRLGYMAIVVAGVVAALHGPGRIGAALYAAVITLFAGVGGTIAARQVWLQHLPPEQVPACGPGLEYMLEQYPLTEALAQALHGSGECASVEWTFLGASIAEWSLVCFVAMAVAHLGYAVWQLRHDATVIGTGGS